MNMETTQTYYLLQHNDRFVSKTGSYTTNLLKARRYITKGLAERYAVSGEKAVPVTITAKTGEENA